MRRFLVTFGLMLLFVAGLGGITYKIIRELTPIEPLSAGDIRSAIGKEGNPLRIADGFRMEMFASDVPGARVIVRDGTGNYWVSQLSHGIVSRLEMEGERSCARMSSSVTSAIRMDSQSIR